jgi:NADH-quinone oxidoreductase subunit L
MQIQLAYAVFLLPVLAAAIIGLVRPIGRNGALAAAISIIAATASLGSALWLMLSGAAVKSTVTWLPMSGRTLAELGVRVDATSAPMLVVVGIVALAVQIYSVGYLAGEPSANRGRYFTWQSLFLFAMQGFVLSPNLLQLFAFYEVIGLCSYLLIGYYHQRLSAGRAAVKAFWVTKLGDVGFLIGLVVAWVWFDTFDLTQLESAVRGGPVPEALWILPALLFCGIASKSAQVPLHVWLPDAMEGPTPVSALLHAATMVAAGVFLLVRTSFLFTAAPAVGTVVMYVGAGTALFAALLGTAQHDIKRVLAYSTCSQLGLMIAAIGAGSVTAGYYHLLTHAFFKALLFLAAGSAIHAVHTNDLREMGGLGRGMRTTALLFAIGMLALAGLPPLSGFWSKELVLAALEHHPVALALGLATTLLTAYYMGRAFLLAFAGAPRSEGARHPHEPGPSMIVPMLVLAAGAVLMGFAMVPFRESLGDRQEFHFGIVGILAVVLAALGLLAAWVMHGPKRGSVIDALPASFLALARSGAIDRVYVFGWRYVLQVIAALVGWFDRYVVDGVMNVLGRVAMLLGSALRRIQTGVVQDYVVALFIGLLALVAWGVWGK